MRGANAVRWILLGIGLFSGASGGRGQTGDGLLGIPWGTGLARLREQFALALADSDSVSARYSSNILHIGGAEVEECLLEFRAETFAGAAVLTHGAHNTHRLRAHLVRVFGKGREENARACQWLRETTHLFYDEDSEGDGYVYWYSRELFADFVPDRSMIRRHPSHRDRQR